MRATGLTGYYRQMNDFKFFSLLCVEEKLLINSIERECVCVHLIRVCAARASLWTQKMTLSYLNTLIVGTERGEKGVGAGVRLLIGWG